MFPRRLGNAPTLKVKEAASLALPNEVLLTRTCNHRGDILPVAEGCPKLVR